MPNYDPKNHLIVALDYPEAHLAQNLVEELDDKVSFYKVGLELFLSSKTDIFFYLKEKGKKVFLDLKFYDIPQTILGACAFPINYEADLFTLHCSSGKKALEMVHQKIKETGSKTLPLGVSVLTSFSQEEFQQTYQTSLSIQESVMNMAKLLKESGLRGIVCSPWEVSSIKALDSNFITVCPGIRYETNQKDDQTRVADPYDTIKNGADFIVVGRSITKALDKNSIIDAIHNDMKRGFYERNS